MTTSTRAADFVASIGVNVHLMDYGNTPLTEQQLSYVGASKIRDTLWPNDPAAVSAFTDVGQHGVKLDAILMGDPAPIKPEIDTLAPYLTSVEGPNEVNVTSPSYNGLTGDSAAIALQKAIYAQVHSDTVLNGNGHSTPVLNFSVAQGGSYSQYGNLSAYADYTNVHAYAEGGVPPYWMLQPVIDGVTDTPGRPPIVTETGNYTMPDHYTGVDEKVQATWGVDSVLQDFQHGVADTYLYQLHDISDPNNTNSNYHYGLYRADGTPKLDATALHNLTTILKDTGPNASSFTPGSLSYSVTGMSFDYGFNQLFAKSDGSFDIALWSEPQMWNASSNSENTITPTTATVALGQTFATVNVYDVLQGSAPIATYQNVNQVQVPIATDPIIIEAKPAASGTQGVLTANNDSGFIVTENTPLTIQASSLLANDSDSDGDLISVSGVSNPSNGTVSYNASNQTIQFTPNAGYTGPANFTYTITDGNSEAGGQLASANVSLTVNAPAPTTLNLFGNLTPVNVSDPEANTLELGVKFQSSQAGSISGIRFYKSAQNTGVHTGELWDNAGKLLATATFTNETASGWQDVHFSTSVSILPNTTYIASYHTNVGHYSGDNNFFNNSYTSGPLTAPSSGSSGGNGVYAQGSNSVFPTSSYAASNYYVDVDFNNNSAPPPTNSSLFSASSTPGTITDPDTNAQEIGVKFQSSSDGVITALRFYKGPQNTGTHVGHLWSSDGTLLASATFTGETSSGWQQVNLSNPIQVTAGKTYEASYHTNVGHYSSDENYFSAAHTSGPLTAPSTGSSGGNGVYALGSSAFPTNTWHGSNYWVDVVFHN